MLYALHVPSQTQPVVAPPIQNNPVIPQQPQQQPQQQLEDDEFGDARNRPQEAVWLLAKLAIFIYMFSQGASITKIIIMHAIAALVFVVQTGLFRMPNFGAFLPRNARPANNDQQQPINNADAIVDNQQVPILTQVWHILLSFFLSLFPPEAVPAVRG